MKITDRELPEAHWKAEAKRRGVKGSTYRMRRHRGMSPREAATTPVRPTTPVLPNPASAESVAREYGLPASSILDWKYRHPETKLSYPEIAKLVLANREKRQREKAFRAECKARGLKPGTVRGWMRKYGLSETEALKRRPKTRQQRGRANKHKLRSRS